MSKTREKKVMPMLEEFAFFVQCYKAWEKFKTGGIYKCLSASHPLELLMVFKAGYKAGFEEKPEITGEPKREQYYKSIAKTLGPDPCDERIGARFSITDLRALDELPAGTVLFVLLPSIKGD